MKPMTAISSERTTHSTPAAPSRAAHADELPLFVRTWSICAAECRGQQGAIVLAAGFARRDEDHRSHGCATDR